MLIEVADSSMEYDQVQKLPRYARAGISEVWLVDVAQHQIEQHARPADENFLDKRTWTDGETLVAAAEQSFQIDLNQLFQ